MNLPTDHKEILAFYVKKQPKAKWELPIVHKKWGYAAFGYFLLRIDNGDKPDDYFVFEKNKNGTFASVKQICQY